MWYNAKVAFSTENDKGQTKIQKVQYLVEDLTVSAVETKLITILTKEGEKDFEIVSVTESKISRVIK